MFVIHVGVVDREKTTPLDRIATHPKSGVELLLQALNSFNPTRLAPYNSCHNFIDEFFEVNLSWR